MSFVPSGSEMIAARSVVGADRAFGREHDADLAPAGQRRVERDHVVAAVGQADAQLRDAGGAARARGSRPTFVTAAPRIRSYVAVW